MNVSGDVMLRYLIITRHFDHSGALHFVVLFN